MLYNNDAPGALIHTEGHEKHRFHFMDAHAVHFL